MSICFKSRIWKLGDNIDTDIIMMTKYLAMSTLDEMTSHLFEPLRPKLASQIQRGDCIVAGENFGCGSSREMAASVLKQAGIKCVIARSFARIFFRNAINNGLLVIESDNLYENCQEGDSVIVEVGKQLTCNHRTFPIPKLSKEVLDILNNGGLLEKIKTMDKSVVREKTSKILYPHKHQVGYTLAEQLIINNIGKEIHAGDVVTVNVDEAVLHDIYVPYIFHQLRKMGFDKAYDINKISVMQDHLYPTCINDDPRCYRYSNRFQDEYGIKRVSATNGIGHQIALECGIAYPGKIIFGTDSHTTSYGAVGAFATGIGYTEMASIVGSGKLWIRVPNAIKVVVNGKLPRGVFPKDIILRVLGDLTASGAIYKSLEFTGSTIHDLSISGRVTIANMAVECGAKVALFEPDAKTADFCGFKQDDFSWLHFDSTATYERILTYDASKLEPCMSCPYSVDNVKLLSQVEGTPIDQVFLGSCTNGRLEDLAVAAHILKDKKINPYVKFIVTPASKQVYLESLKLGYIKILLSAGAMITHPYCSLCQGRSGGLVSDDEVVIGTHNRNFIGRMGSPKARTYLGSPAIAAASALEGKIADPRKYF